MICGDCPGPEKCKDRPSAAEPITDASIDLRLEQCPLEYVSSDIWEAIRYAKLYEKGLPPVAGGALDQAENFLEAAEMVFADRAFFKQKLKVF